MEAQGSQRDRKDSIVSFVSSLSSLWLNFIPRGASAGEAG